MSRRAESSAEAARFTGGREMAVLEPRPDARCAAARVFMFAVLKNGACGFATNVRSIPVRDPVGLPTIG